MTTPITHYVITAGSKIVACYMDVTEANTFSQFLTTAGAHDMAVVPTIAGISGDPTGTCDAYLEGAEVIVSGVVTILNAA